MKQVKIVMQERYNIGTQCVLCHVNQDEKVKQIIFSVL